MKKYLYDTYFRSTGDRCRPIEQLTAVVCEKQSDANIRLRDEKNMPPEDPSDIFAGNVQQVDIEEEDVLLLFANDGYVEATVHDTESEAKGQMRKQYSDIIDDTAERAEINEGSASIEFKDEYFKWRVVPVSKLTHSCW